MTRPRGLMLLDAAVAVFLTCLAAYATLDPPGPAFTGPVGVVWLAAAATGLPIAARRRRPLPVLAVVAAAAAVATATGVIGLGIIAVAWFPVVLALYTAATVAGRVTALIALTGSLAAPAVTIPWLYARTGITSADAAASEVALWWPVELGVVLIALVLAWIAGRLIRWRRSLQAEAAGRLARDAVAEERLRIARELHDIVGHSLSLIAVKATVANHIAEQRPDESRAALLTIEKTSRSALTEIRRLLDVLRADDDSAELAPSPGIAQLPGLVAGLGAAGPQIDLDADSAAELPVAVDVTVYRIVQESLTNVMKHADAARCRVTVRVDGGRVRIEVCDDGRGRRSAGRPGGQGLIGMRERVSMYGGTLSTGPRPEGGFRVAAEIPYATTEEAA
ncbi:sensor histidine kinase [Actinoplanes sp. NPDC023936]|uniref:sensor histidine kinase n=1 Tax=Actinoplanes sp. NPDC023936 TaxID=3154910 RepID=UPI0033F8F3BA